MVLEASAVLATAEANDAITVIALFELYNAFVDLHGVAALSEEGYAATGRRLSTEGYRL